MPSAARSADHVLVLWSQYLEQVPMPPPLGHVYGPFALGVLMGAPCTQSDQLFGYFHGNADPSGLM